MEFTDVELERLCPPNHVRRSAIASLGLRRSAVVIQKAPEGHGYYCGREVIDTNHFVMHTDFGMDRTPVTLVADLDRVVHEPARLLLLTHLAVCAQADFVFLAQLTGLTAGNLSQHLDKLHRSGLIEVAKTFVGKRSQTMVTITGLGRHALDRHWQQLDTLRLAAASASGQALSSPDAPRLVETRERTKRPGRARLRLAADET